MSFLATRRRKFELLAWVDPIGRILGSYMFRDFLNSNIGVYFLLFGYPLVVAFSVLGVGKILYYEARAGGINSPICAILSVLASCLVILGPVINNEIEIMLLLTLLSFIWGSTRYQTLKSFIR